MCKKKKAQFSTFEVLATIFILSLAAILLNVPRAYAYQTVSTELYEYGPLNPGQSFSVNIIIDDVYALHAFEFTLSWNPRILLLNSQTPATEGSFLPQGGDTTFQYSIGVVGESITVSDTLTTEGYWMDGGGRLATIYFDVIGGEDTDLVLTANLLDPDHNNMGASTIGGHFLSPAAYFAITLPITIGGTEYPVTIGTNGTITDAVVTPNTIHFKATGETGKTYYIITTFPKVNTTEIKVFMDGNKLEPPPFPVWSSNSTHYFIYFEYVASTHEIVIEYAPPIGPIPAELDINPETLNLKSEGTWITAYIQLPEGYDPADIDASTILLNDTISPVIDPKYSFVTDSSEYLVDQNNDGVLERMVKFDRATLESWIYHTQGIKYGNVALTITGKLLDATPFEGTDGIFVNYAGDVNNDGIINSLDIGVINTNWGTNNLNADLNCDGRVNSLDMGIINANWGRTVP